jgi:hypothetical protein
MKLKLQIEIPQEGWHRAICSDIMDRGCVATEYGNKHLVRFTWLIVPEGSSEPLRIRKSYNATLHPKSNLLKDLSAWVGSEELQNEFDLMKLKGKKCQLKVAHFEAEGQTMRWPREFGHGVAELS